MPRAALIAAQIWTESGADLRAVFPLAGRTLIEHQVRLACAAGAHHIVILVDRLPATLMAAVDRLRASGVAVEIARSPADVVERIHPDESVIVIGDACVAGQSLVDRIASLRPPALLVVPDTPGNEAFERIDAQARWAGVAIVDHYALRATVDMLGEWDLVSTLLRRAVQNGAERVDGAELDRDVVPPFIADAPAALVQVERGLIRDARPVAEDAPQRYLYPLLVDPLLRALIKRSTDAPWIGVGALVAALIGLVWSALEYPAIALGFLLLSAIAMVLAQRLGRLWALEDVRQMVDWLDKVRVMATAGSLILLGTMLAERAGWGWLLLATNLIMLMAILAALKAIAKHFLPAARPIWLASIDMLLWLAPMVGILSGWYWMIAALTGYAGVCVAYIFWRIGTQLRHAT